MDSENLCNYQKCCCSKNSRTKILASMEQPDLRAQMNRIGRRQQIIWKEINQIFVLLKRRPSMAFDAPPAGGTTRTCSFPSGPGLRYAICFPSGHHTGQPPRQSTSCLLFRHGPPRRSAKNTLLSGNSWRSGIAEISPGPRSEQAGHAGNKSDTRHAAGCVKYVGALRPLPNFQ